MKHSTNRRSRNSVPRTTSGKLLTVDIGNTSVHAAPYANGRFGKSFRVPTASLKKGGLAAFRNQVKRLGSCDTVIASVVPSAGTLLKKDLSKLTGVRAFLVGKDIPVPIRNRYKNPAQVGVDRLLGATAAYQKYPRELIVIDFGTAITFDVVSKNGEYLGGVIAPGIEISLEALFQKTALLPKIRLAHPVNWIGRDTAESIQVGCSVGIGGLCDRTVESISKRYKMKPLVIATGGYAAFMRRYCRRIDAIDLDLVHKGLVFSFLEHRKNR